uniref:Uncharacterized protein n=1 Tax=Cyanoderma ruficeps TaxID=181631 RepID=A0A8C3QQN7_9PASS
MSRVPSANMARHCAWLSGVSADSTTRRTITRFSGSGCDELTSPSRILSMAPGASAERRRRGAARAESRPGGDGGTLRRRRLSSGTPRPSHGQRPMASEGGAGAGPGRDGAGEVRRGGAGRVGVSRGVPGSCGVQGGGGLFRLYLLPCSYRVPPARSVRSHGDAGA